MTSPESLTQKWLRQNVQSYSLKERVYSDVDSVLSRFHTLRPKLDVYTYDDGRTQLLLCVHGLLPISFRNASYNIPIAIWLTREYPRQPPICYVVPTNDMLVKAGRYVDVSGKCDIEYSQNWVRKSEGCYLSGLLEAMQDQFSREPPLYAQPKNNVSPGPRVDQVYPIRPPPPVPPTAVPTASSQTSQPLDRPALPPKPGSPTVINSLTTSQSTTQGATTLSRVEPPPPRPKDPSPPQYRTHPPLPVNFLPSFRSNPIGDVTPPPPPPPPETRISTSDPHWSIPSPPVIPPLSSQGSSPKPTYSPPALPTSPYHHPPQGHIQHPQASHHSPDLDLQSPRPSPASAVNLLDEDFPGSQLSNSALRSASTAPPPRPPNPEILDLHARVHKKFSSELASLIQVLALDAERLRAHQSDLLAGEPAIRDEMARLEAVRDVCRNVAGRMRSTVDHAETNIAELRRKGDPEVDELVCSTTIVHNQLINLVAEDNAIEDTIYHLHRALNSGRIDLERFLRTTRLLAEEQFMKRALIEKIQAGMPMVMSMGSEWS